MTDFQPIALINDVPMTIVTKADFPAKDFKELISYVQKNADKITLANAGIGAASHLCGLMFMSALDRQLTPVPYKGTAPGADRPHGWTGRPDVRPDHQHHAADQVRQDQGLRGHFGRAPRPVPGRAYRQGIRPAHLQIGIWHALYAPKGTPKAVVDKLVAAPRRPWPTRALQKRFAELGAVMYPKDKQTPEAVASQAEGRDRPVGTGDQEGRRLRRLTGGRKACSCRNGATPGLGSRRFRRQATRRACPGWLFIACRRW